MGIIMIITRILTTIVWVLIGIWTFNWVGVDSFGRAIFWLFEWHFFTAIAILILYGIGIWIGDKIEKF